MYLLRIFLVVFLMLLSCISCNRDPNKEVDEGFIVKSTYNSDDIGWTIEIPEGWKVINRGITQQREGKGLALITETSELEYNLSTLNHLIGFQKDRFPCFSIII